VLKGKFDYRARMTGADEFDGFIGKFSLPLFHERRFLANPSEPVIPSAVAGSSEYQIRQQSSQVKASSAKAEMTKGNWRNT
jgi:hypothetical protein